MSQWLHAFGPEAVPVLTAAFEKAWENFLHSSDRRLQGLDKARNELAACVTETFIPGELDSSRLAREGLAELRRQELSRH